MDRRSFLAAATAALAGCLGGPAASDEPPPSPGGGGGAATSTGEGTPIAPLVNWSFSLDVDRAVATIVHGTGDPLTTDRTDRLELVLTTAPDHPIPSDATLTPTKTPRVIRRTWREAGGTYPIATGDSVLFEPATPGDTLEVWWYGVDHHREGTRLETATFDQV